MKTAFFGWSWQEGLILVLVLVLGSFSAPFFRILFLVPEIVARHALGRRQFALLIRKIFARHLSGFRRHPSRHHPSRRQALDGRRRHALKGSRQAWRRHALDSTHPR